MYLNFFVLYVKLKLLILFVCFLQLLIKKIHFLFQLFNLALKSLAKFIGIFFLFHQGLIFLVFLLQFSLNILDIWQFQCNFVFKILDLMIFLGNSFFMRFHFFLKVSKLIFSFNFLPHQTVKNLLAESIVRIKHIDQIFNFFLIAVFSNCYFVVVVFSNSLDLLCYLHN